MVLCLCVCVSVLGEITKWLNKPTDPNAGEEQVNPAQTRLQQWSRVQILLDDVQVA